MFDFLSCAFDANPPPSLVLKHDFHSIFWRTGVYSEHTYITYHCIRAWATGVFEEREDALPFITDDWLGFFVLHAYLLLHPFMFFRWGLELRSILYYTIAFTRRNRLLIRSFLYRLSFYWKTECLTRTNFLIALSYYVSQLAFSGPHFSAPRVWRLRSISYYTIAFTRRNKF